MRSKKRYYRVDRRKIGYMKFIFEGYDGIANLTTLNADLGIISINIPDGCDSYVDKLLDVLGADILIEPVIREDA